MKWLIKRTTILVAQTILFAGCAPAYHDYPCGRVSCSYCPPNPLPYSTYDPCNCNDSIGRQYLANMPTGHRVEIEVENTEKMPDQEDRITNPGQ